MKIIMLSKVGYGGLSGIQCGVGMGIEKLQLSAVVSFAWQRNGSETWKSFSLR